MIKRGQVRNGILYSWHVRQSTILDFHWLIYILFSEKLIPSKFKKKEMRNYDVFSYLRGGKGKKSENPLSESMEKDNINFKADIKENGLPFGNRLENDVVVYYVSPFLYFWTRTETQFTQTQFGGLEFPRRRSPPINASLRFILIPESNYSVFSLSRKQTLISNSSHNCPLQEELEARDAPWRRRRRHSPPVTCCGLDGSSWSSSLFPSVFWLFSAYSPIPKSPWSLSRPRCLGFIAWAFMKAILRLLFFSSRVGICRLIFCGEVSSRFSPIYLGIFSGKFKES